MYTQERTTMSNLVVGGPVAVNSYDNAIVAALLENRPVMLVHAFNGGYLRPAELKEESHGSRWSSFAVTSIGWRTSVM